jgi:DNA-binding GntR family transcriptional regulator
MPITTKESVGLAPNGDAVPLYVAIETAISQAIESRALVSNDVLTEAAVADVLGTSRTPVKLAFERLLTQGLIRKSGGWGFVVAGTAEHPGPRRRIGREDIARLIPALPAQRSPAAWMPIYDEVERDVSAHSAFAAFRIIEVELANIYGVSRTVAHEVLARLERLGLVNKDRRGRWFVVPLTNERVKQIYEVRSYLEPPALRAAAERIPQAELCEMWKRLISAQQRYPRISVIELDALERDIHVECIGYCGNDELLKLLRINQPLLICNKHMLGSYLELPQLDPFLAEHKSILECLGARDGKAAAKALEAHLAASVPKVLQRLAELKQTERPSGLSYLVEP